MYHLGVRVVDARLHLYSCHFISRVTWYAGVWNTPMDRLPATVLYNTSIVYGLDVFVVIPKPERKTYRITSASPVDPTVFNSREDARS